MREKRILLVNFKPVILEPKQKRCGYCGSTGKKCPNCGAPVE